MSADRLNLTLADLRAANIERQREWDKAGGIDLSYRGNELAGELGEALVEAVDLILMAAAAGRASNVIKKLERERLGIRGSRATTQQLADELADVVICVDLIAMAQGIDVGDAVVAKFNATSEKVGLATRLQKAAPRDAVTECGVCRRDFDPDDEQAVCWDCYCAPIRLLDKLLEEIDPALGKEADADELTLGALADIVARASKHVAGQRAQISSLQSRLQHMERETVGLRRFTCLWCGHQSEWTEDAGLRDAQEREHAARCEKGPLQKLARAQAALKRLVDHLHTSNVINVEPPDEVITEALAVVAGVTPPTLADHLPAQAGELRAKIITARGNVASGAVEIGRERFVELMDELLRLVPVRMEDSTRETPAPRAHCHRCGREVAHNSPVPTCGECAMVLRAAAGPAYDGSCFRCGADVNTTCEHRDASDARARLAQSKVRP